MLNSEDLQQLKIDALLQHSYSNYPSRSFPDLTNAFPSNSIDHVLITSSPNSNIIAFSYVLLTHIFDNRSSANSPTSSNASPSSHQNSGGGSKPFDKVVVNNSTAKFKEKQDHYQLKDKLNRFNSYILANKIHMSQIINIPQKLQRAIKSQQKLSSHLGKAYTNKYLKKLLFQLIKIMRQSYNINPRPNSKNNSSNIKQPYVAKILKKYPICEILMSIFIRSILYFQYQIADAIDYNKHISDQTVYTALCDAFQYTTLKIQQNYTEISYGSYIRFLRKKKNNQLKGSSHSYYLISLPQVRFQTLNSKDMQQVDTFRIRRKSSDQISNNQSASFRQSSRQATQKGNSNQKQKAQNQLIKPSSIAPINAKPSQNPEQKAISSNIQSQSTLMTLKKINSNDKIFSIENINLNQEQTQFNTTDYYKIPKQKAPIQLNGYTSLQLLKYLNPNVRQSMVKNLNHFRQCKI